MEPENKCPHCGAAMEEGTTTCPECGKDVSAPVEAAMPADDAAM